MCAERFQCNETPAIRDVTTWGKTGLYIKSLQNSSFQETNVNRRQVGGGGGIEEANSRGLILKSTLLIAHAPTYTNAQAHTVTQASM